MLVSLIVVVRVIVLRVVAPSSSPASSGWVRPVEECESPTPAAEMESEPSGSGDTPGGACSSGMGPFSACGGAGPCSAATCELSVPALVMLGAEGLASPLAFVSVSAGGGADSDDDSEVFISMSVLYSDAVCWPYSIDMVASRDPVSEVEGASACASFGEMIVDEDDGEAPALGGGALESTEGVGSSDCFPEPSLGVMIVDGDGDGGPSLRGVTMGLAGGAVCGVCSCAPSLGGLIADEDGGGALLFDASELGLESVAVCEDCDSNPSCVAIFVDEDGGGGLGLPGDCPCEPPDGTPWLLETGHTVV